MLMSHLSFDLAICLYVGKSLVTAARHQLRRVSIQLSFLASSATRLPNCLAVSRSPLRGASSTEAPAGEIS
jgi:hypothetical protein